MGKFENKNGRHALNHEGFPLRHPTKILIPGKKFSGHFIYFLTALLLLLQVSFPSQAQSPPNEALWSENGYSLKKVVSNTTIASGVNFSYTIIFSAPAGVSSVSIQDIVPSSLQVVSVTAAGPVCTVTPVTTVAGNLVSYNLSSLPPACAPSGSFTIVVKFPEGVTCNGESARNRAEILVGDKWQPTPYVSTTATAVNPWKVTKTIIGGASVNPNGGSCGYIMAPGDTITYRLAVLKDNPYFGNVTGQQNMTSAVVTDILPTGAVFVPGTNPCVSFSGGTITWNVNCPTQLLDAAIPWAYYWTDIKIYYPAASFPVNTQVLNQATLTGISCLQQESHTSNQTCITVVPPNPSGNFSKYISLANRVPGCSGMYYITFCNNGNVPLSAFNINDAIPAGVTVTGITIYGANATTTVNLNINSSPFATGITGTYNSGVISTPVNNVQLQMTGSLPVNGCVYLYISFTVNPNPTGTVVTNCATFAPLANSLTLNPVCASFTVEAGTPKPCLLKDICLPQSSYNPGDIVRFRLRVQNIGSADITGASIQDVLHSNFTYVGNESYYVANSFSVGCSTGSTLPSGASAWTGVSSSHSGNNLSWNLPNVPADCQLFYSAWCGYYGTWGIPYYFIEFDAQVDSFALPGVTPNSYQVSGGNVPSAVSSNVVNVLVVASFGQEVEKQLSTDGGTSFASAGTAAPGSNARFRLNYKNTSNVPVTSVQLVDLLGRDDGTNDWTIFNRTLPRGSQFDVSYTGNHATSLLPVATPPSPTLSWATGQNICLPPYVASGCNPVTWGAVPDRNIRAEYGSLFNLAPNTNLLEDFDVGIPLTALNGQKVCNDFAAIATANFLLNGSPQAVALTPVASPVVCLTIDTTIVSVSCCDSIKVERAPGGDGVIGCCARFTATCPVDSIKITVSNGTLASINWNCGTLPPGFAGQSSVTLVAGGCIPDITTCVDPTTTGTVFISYQVVFSNGEKCEKRFELDCTVAEPKCCDNVKIQRVDNPDGTDACCARITTECEVKSIDVSIHNGTFSSVSWNCGTLPTGFTGQSSFTFNANNCALDMVTCVTPDSTGLVVISYVIHFTNGEVCEKRIELDCKVEEPKCCDNVKLERVTDADGTDACCARLVTECEVKSIDVSIHNGTFSNVSWNCGTLPSGYTGQSSFTFNANNCAVDMVTCVTPDSTGLVVISYVIHFTNGEVCEKRIELDCKVPTSETCCALANFKLKSKWPFWKTQVGTFNIINADPSVPICYIEISPSPAGSFTTGNLIVDGVTSAQSWNTTRIPASGNLTPSAVNTVDFSLVSNNYSGTVTICVVKCDGTRCCFEFKWNKPVIGHVDLSLDKAELSTGLKAVSISPDVSSDLPNKIKYVAFGLSSEEEVTGNASQFFAISASPHEGDDYPAGLASTISASMGKNNAFFELSQAKGAGEAMGYFNLVFAGKLPKLGCTLFDEEGSILYDGEVNLAGSDTVITSLNLNASATAGNMFELIKVFPNPSDGVFTVTYTTGTPREVEMRIVTSSGLTVDSKRIDDRTAGVHNLNIRTSGLASGMYMVILVSEGETRSKPLIIK
jgi:uncharacterized repeat protein (TIGR01451 family)